MKVAVITPYYKEDIQTLIRCRESVIMQTHSDVFHVMVADGYPNDEINAWDVVHIKGPPHNDFGDTPRTIGAISAISKGAQALCFLDADNWLEPDHIERLLRVHEDSAADIVTATRNLRRTDGSFLGVCTESNGQYFTDTNCYFLTRPTFGMLMAWIVKEPGQSIIGDKLFWQTLVNAGFSRAHCATPTVNYTTTFAYHYQQFGERPSPDSKVI